MPTDFSDFSGGDLIPAKTIAVLQMRVRPGDGTDNVLRRTKNGDGEGLDAELTVVEGPFMKRKLFWYILLSGESDGQRSMAETNKSRLKQLIDSARNLDPSDRSPEARARRTLGWRDFDGLRFLAEIGIEQSRDGFPDKNVVSRIVTRDQAAWRGPIEQVATDYGSAPNGTKPSSAPPVMRPSWAS
jgi:hypothetical protein